jgi:transposase
MLGKQFNQKIQPNDHDLFVGMDTDKASIVVDYLSHEDKQRVVKMPNKPEQLVSTTRNLFPNQRPVFAYEAGPTGWGLYDHLTKEGYKCLVVAPSMIPVTPGSRVKTNRLDAQQIALRLRGGELKGIQVPSQPYRHLRHLVQLRDVLSQQMLSHKRRVRSLLLLESLPYPSDGFAWSRKVMLSLRTMNIYSLLRFKLDQFLDQIEQSQSNLLKVQREIRRFCQEDVELSKNIQLLMTVPGLGWIVSSHLLARIGDPSFLQRSHQISSFIGLVCRESSTGNRVWRGRITRSGDPRLRSKLIQASWVAIKKDESLEEFYKTIYSRHPKDQAPKKAIVAVANKLCRRIVAVLKHQMPYRKQLAPGEKLGVLKRTN